jgi:hypothetical protein
LEKSATDLQVTDANGLNRFKNGIFVNPFNDHSLSDVSNPEYKIAIDEAQSLARPFFRSETIETAFSNASSTNVQQTGRLITLPYTTITYVKQPFASKFRSAAAVAYKWNGTVKLYPPYDDHIDTINNAQVQVTIDNTQAWNDFANSPFGQQWGDWRTTQTTSSVTSGTVDTIHVAGGTQTVQDPDTIVRQTIDLTQQGGDDRVGTFAGWPPDRVAGMIGPNDTINVGADIVYSDSGD